MLVITFAFGIVITDNSLSIDYEGKRIFYPVGFIFAPDFFRGKTQLRMYISSRPDSSAPGENPTVRHEDRSRIVFHRK